jgi:DNA ligase-1
MPEMPYEPMLCEPSDARILDAIKSDRWICQPKLDGERIIAQRKLGQIYLWTRRRKNVAKKFPEIVEALKHLPQVDWILDGELLAEGGFASILRRNTDDALKIAILSKKMPATYHVFDILQIAEMVMVRNLVLEERQAILLTFSDWNKPRLKLVESYPATEARNLFDKITAQEGEGVVLKCLDSMYEPGLRSRNWLKVKKLKVVDVQVVGATKSDAGLPFASLILLKDGEYFGKVGTGFSDSDRSEILELLKTHSDGSRGISLPRPVENETLIRCAPIDAEITLQEEINGSPRFPVWHRFRTEAE